MRPGTALVNPFLSRLCTTRRAKPRIGGQPRKL